MKRGGAVGKAPIGSINVRKFERREVRAVALDLERAPLVRPDPGAIEALADLSRAEADLIFGQAGQLVHHGSDTEPLRHSLA